MRLLQLGLDLLLQILENRRGILLGRGSDCRTEEECGDPRETHFGEFKLQSGTVTTMWRTCINGG